MKQMPKHSSSFEGVLGYIELEKIQNGRYLIFFIIHHLMKRTKTIIIMTVTLCQGNLLLLDRETNIQQWDCTVCMVIVGLMACINPCNPNNRLPTCYSHSFFPSNSKQLSFLTKVNLGLEL